MKGLNKFEVRGTPTDEQSTIELWKQNPNAFQDWWLTEFEVFSTTFGTKGADKGVDGLAQYLVDPKKQEIIKAAFQVKGGHIQSKDIDALLGAIEKHKCEIGVFLTIEVPTKPMLDTVAGAGFVEIPGLQNSKASDTNIKRLLQGTNCQTSTGEHYIQSSPTKRQRNKTQMKMEM
ncbi:MAG: restriction endonuclease [Ignavibacteriaceae bacterium]|nr:restriction endonuclease [Ignavibacteriaceae bacterium]